MSCVALSSQAQLVVCCFLFRSTFGSYCFLPTSVPKFIMRYFVLASSISLVLLFPRKHVWFTLLSARSGFKLRLVRAAFYLEAFQGLSCGAFCFQQRLVLCCFLLVSTIRLLRFLLVGVPSYVLCCFPLAVAISFVLLSPRKLIWFALLSAQRRSKIYFLLLCTRRHSKICHTLFFARRHIWFGLLFYRRRSKICQVLLFARRRK